MFQLEGLNTMSEVNFLEKRFEAVKLHVMFYLLYVQTRQQNPVNILEIPILGKLYIYIVFLMIIQTLGLRV